MYKGKIIDCHAHIYPAKIAPKAVKSIEDFYSLPASCDGTPESLARLGKMYNVEYFLVHSTATKKEQVRKINDYIASEISARPEFVGYGTLHYDMTAKEICDEIERMKKNGIRGIKLHPDFQRFFIDAPVMDNIYSACRDYSLPVLTHVGDPRTEYSRPERLARTAKRYPDLKFIAAHFGGFGLWDTVDCYSDTQNVWFDTSSSLFSLSAERAAEIINDFGAEKFLFGTDFPLFSCGRELERFHEMALPDETQEAILYKNAKSFLRLP